MKIENIKLFAFISKNLRVINTQISIRNSRIEKLPKIILMKLLSGLFNAIAANMLPPKKLKKVNRKDKNME